jgi:hypothetical protein
MTKTKRSRPDMIGNQYARGHGCGRPPEVYQDDELVELGIEMIQWFKDNPDAYWIQEFAIHKMIPFNVLWKLGDRKVFSYYYDIAKSI